MAPVRLTVIGCSPAWPNPGGAQSGYLLEDSGSLLLDCGPGVLARLREREVWPSVDAIVLTHFHLDHWGDLVPWVWGSFHLASRGRTPSRPLLRVPPAGRARLEQFGTLLGFADMFERAFEIDEYEPGVPFELAGYRLTALRVPHYTVDAYAVRVADGDRTLAYSGDSGPGDALIELARDADLFLCEATLLRPEDDGLPRGHLSLDEAEAVFTASGAADLLITHRPLELAVPAGRALAHDGLVREL